MSNALKLSLIAATAVIVPSPAFAYIDPAVGSMMLQGIIGAIAVAGTAWYTLRQKVSDFFGGQKSVAGSENAAAESKELQS
ncbi:MAG TPA: hypothetical protein VMX97_14515 [Hyphomicrobiaceae bacterium]|nr:hypothetical protein [Hyphomicrobiaceae bacterium]